MDKLTQHIKILNEVYKSMKRSFDTLEKLFKKNSSIYQKIILTEQMADDIYRSIYDKIQSDTINEEFIKIVKGAKNADKKRNRG
jgi:uncharacterized protein Yka (UPF0111/DUF47 family)